MMTKQARNRIGGRLLTDRPLCEEGSGNGVDLGGAWLHRVDGNPLTPLCHRFGADVLPTDDLDEAPADIHPGNAIVCELGGMCIRSVCPSAMLIVGHPFRFRSPSTWSRATNASV
jgi:hypothetical protein